MALSSAYWADEGADLHIVRGNSRSIHGLLRIWDSATGEVVPKDDPAAAGNALLTRITYTAEFKGAPNAHGVELYDAGGGDYTLRVNASWGTGAHVLRNFLVFAKIEHTSNEAVSPIEIAIRVHIHEQLDHAWLTPSAMRLPSDSEPQGFTVLGVFTDGVFANLSYHPGIQWAVDPASTGSFAVDPSWGWFNAPSGTATMAATLPADLGSKVLRATVEEATAWATAADVRLVPGSVPGAIGDAVNVLLVPEGFLDGEEETFKEVVTKLVYGLGSSIFQPIKDLLKAGKLRFWWTFFPSRERGSSVRAVMRESGSNGIPMPPATKPSGSVQANWTTTELFYEVGLPTPVTNIDPAHVRAEWDALYGKGNKAGDLVDDFAIEVWADYATVTWFNELDTALGLAVKSDGRTLTTHPFRRDKTDLDKRLRLLRDPGSGATIGATWASGGADESYVVAVAAGTHYAGGGGVIVASSMTTPAFAQFKIAADAVAREIVPLAIPSTWSPEAMAKILHEIAHGFGLDDEYAEFESPLALPASRVANLGLNLQAAEPPLVPSNGVIDALEIRWRWPRIESAAVLIGPPSAAGGRYKVLVGRGQGVRRSRTNPSIGFASGQLVRLRAPDVTSSPRMSEPLVVDGDPTFDASVNADVVYVRWPNAAPVAAPRPDPNDPGQYTEAGCILFAPKLDASGKELTLVHPDVEAHISSTDLPLNAAPGRTFACTRNDGALGSDGGSTMNAQNLPGNLLDGVRAAPKYSAWVVGIYEGGDQHYCGVYHPTGACLMRNLVVPSWWAVNPSVQYSFCPVCRYLLVDKFAPFLHGVIDRSYERRYPK